MVLQQQHEAQHVLRQDLLQLLRTDVLPKVGCRPYNFCRNRTPINDFPPHSTRNSRDASVQLVLAYLPSPFSFSEGHSQESLHTSPVPHHFTADKHITHQHPTPQSTIPKPSPPPPPPTMTSLPTTYPTPIHIAVIGGTGFYDLPGFTTAAVLHPTTPWGAPSSPITVLEHTTPSGSLLPVAFLSRHGLNHSFAPSEVPNRANIAALRKLGVRCIVSFSAAGSLREEIKPRDFVVPDQVIDRTWGREGTFFGGGVVCHVPMADPYDQGLREVVLRCKDVLEGQQQQQEGGESKLHDGGTVVVIQGPAFSTRAESKMYRQWGGDVINMSSFPEAKLAREAEMGYVQIVMSTDYDCWKGEEDVSVEMVMGHMKANLGNAKRLVGKVLDELGRDEYRDLREGKAWEGQRRFGVSTKKEGMGKEALEKLEWLFPGYFVDHEGRAK